MSQIDWRSSRAYEDIQSLDAPGLAWEFLRRNSIFMHDRRALERAMRQRILTHAEKDAFALKWGLRFRPSERTGKYPNRAMDGTSIAERHCPYERLSEPF